MEVETVRPSMALTRHITVHTSMHLQVEVAVVDDLFRRSIISMGLVEKRLLPIMVLHQVGVVTDARQIDSIESQRQLIIICSYDKLSDISKQLH